MTPEFEFQLLLMGIATAIGFAMLGFAGGVMLMTYIATAPFLAKSKQNDGA